MPQKSIQTRLISIVSKPTKVVIVVVVVVIVFVVFVKKKFGPKKSRPKILAPEKF